MPRDYKVYLDDILLAIDRIQNYTKEYTKEQFCEDSRTVDAVVRNLEILGQAVKHIPQEIRNQSSEVEWRKIGALRDILAHEYFGVDLEIIWDVILNKLPTLKNEVRKLL